MMKMLFSVFGIYFILDGVFSFVYVNDKKLLWQLARLSRIIFGIFQIVLSILFL